jgi:putative endonuclease
MNQLYVYILLCADDSYYVGVTNNLELRLEQHNNGEYKESAYTFSRRPCEIVYYEVVKYPNKAIAREKQIKKWGRAKKEALINAQIDKLHELAKCKNETSHDSKLRDNYD